MKRPTELIKSLNMGVGRYYDVDSCVKIANYITYLESRIQPVAVNQTSAGDKAATQPRKTVGDAVDYFDGVWPADKFEKLRYDKGRYAWGLCEGYFVCTREQFEAEVERRKGGEWTHKTNAGESCKIIVKNPDSKGVIIVMNERGEYLRHNFDIKPIKPTISKAEAWSKLMVEYEGAKGQSIFSTFYEILEQFEVK